MAAKFVQNSRKYRAGPPRDAAHPADTPDDRGATESEVGVQNEYRFLEPGAGAAAEHGAEPVQLEPEQPRAGELNR